MNKVFFRIIENGVGGVELHCSMHKAEVVQADALCKAIGQGDANRDRIVAEWRREMFLMGDHLVELDDSAAGRVKKLFSVVDVAGSTGFSATWIQKLGPELISKGFAEKVGKVLVLKRAAVKYIAGRPEKRGRKKLQK